MPEGLKEIENKTLEDEIAEFCSLRNSQSQWIVGAFTSHQLAATCKTNKKTTVVFRRPSDGKVSSFLRD